MVDVALFSMPSYHHTCLGSLPLQTAKISKIGLRTSADRHFFPTPLRKVTAFRVSNMSQRNRFEHQFCKKLTERRCAIHLLAQLGFSPPGRRWPRRGHAVLAPLLSLCPSSSSSKSIEISQFYISSSANQPYSGFAQLVFRLLFVHSPPTSYSSKFRNFIFRRPPASLI